MKKGSRSKKGSTKENDVRNDPLHSGAVRRMREESVRRSSTDAGSHNTGNNHPAATSAPEILSSRMRNKRKKRKI